MGNKNEFKSLLEDRYHSTIRVHMDEMVPIIVETREGGHTCLGKVHCSQGWISGRDEEGPKWVSHSKSNRVIWQVSNLSTMDL